MLGAIAGGIAEAYFGPLPTPLASEVRRRLPAELLTVVEAFAAKYCSDKSSMIDYSGFLPMWIAECPAA